MWDTTGYPDSPDNENMTIIDVLRNETIDLVILNIAAHVQTHPLETKLQIFMNFMNNIANF